MYIRARKRIQEPTAAESVDEFLARGGEIKKLATTKNSFKRWNNYKNADLDSNNRSSIRTEIANHHKLARLKKKHNK